MNRLAKRIYCEWVFIHAKTEQELTLMTFQKTMEECAAVISLLLLSVSLVYTVKQYFNEMKWFIEHLITEQKHNQQSKILNSFFLILPHVLSIFYKLNETTKESPSSSYIFLYHGLVFI